MARKMWVYNPHAGGRKIPDAIKPRLRQRILEHAEKHYSGRYNRIDVRFRVQFCYIDAYIEPYLAGNYDPKLHGESRKERMQRLRNTPTRLCRLRYFGDEDRWSMAFYSHGNEKYEPCVFDNGGWHGTPEEAIDASAVYLNR